MRRSRALPFLLSFAIGCGGSAEEAAPKPAAAVQTRSDALSGAANDVGTPQANVVVRLLGNTAMCTGTLITPTAVLTARHCVCNDEDNTGQMTFPIKVQIGNDITGFSDASTFRITSAAQMFPTFNCDPLETPDEMGADLGILFLDAPVLDHNLVVPSRPSLTAPRPSDPDDSNGGTYPMGIGMAGWALNDSPRFRRAQTFVGYGFRHYPDWSGQLWLYDQEQVNSNGGDSGGPLFVVRPDGSRDVIGVLSGSWWYSLVDCGIGVCSIYTDITRGWPADWVRTTMRESRGPNWHQQHPGDLWKGEADYFGPCRLAQDRDCDHWFDAHDNCIDIKNYDQLDTNDDRVGDACEGQWPGLGFGGIPSAGAEPPQAAYIVANERHRRGAPPIVVGIGTDHNVYLKRQSASYAWDDWASGPQRWVKRVAAVGMPDGLDVLAVGSDDQPYVFRRYGNDAVSDWSQIPLGPGLRDVQAIGGIDIDGVIFFLTLDGDVIVMEYAQLWTSSSWMWLNGRAIGAPLNLYSPPGGALTTISVTRAGDLLHVVGIDGAGAVWKRSQVQRATPARIWDPLRQRWRWGETYSRQWAGWVKLPDFYLCGDHCSVDNRVAQVVAAHSPVNSPGGSRLVVFAVRDGKAYSSFATSNAEGAQLSSWRGMPFGDVSVQQLAVANNGDGGPGLGRLEMFAVGADERVSSVWQNGSLQDADFAGPGRRGTGPLRDISAAVNYLDGRIEIFAISPDTQTLRHDWQIYESWGIRWLK